MVRFKVSPCLLFFVFFGYLHSSMVRFKAMMGATRDGYGRIYIPVWFDLKACIVSELDTAYHDLHSSMVRFKGHSSKISLTLCNIYIPVWFDLKGNYPAQDEN